MLTFAPNRRASRACPNSWTITDTVTTATQIASRPAIVSGSVSTLRIRGMPNRHITIKNESFTRRGIPNSLTVNVIQFLRHCRA